MSFPRQIRVYNFHLGLFYGKLYSISSETIFQHELFMLHDLSQQIRINFFLYCRRDNE